MFHTSDFIMVLNIKNLLFVFFLLHFLINENVVKKCKVKFQEKALQPKPSHNNISDSIV